MRESKVEKHLHKAVTAAGGTTRKFKSPNYKNVPDRIVIWPVCHTIKFKAISARVEFVELKAPGKDANAAQAREHVRLQKLGCVVLVLDTIEKVDRYVERNK